MNDDLDRRYQILFERYGGAKALSIVRIRESIARECAVRDIALRSDGLLFLLVNLHQIILRPYSRVIPGSETPKAIMRMEEAYTAISKALGIILEGLEGESPYSSHAVMKSIQLGWDDLSEVFFWG